MNFNTSLNLEHGGSFYLVLLFHNRLTSEKSEK
jgi:hypothetical protein